MTSVWRGEDKRSPALAGRIFDMTKGSPLATLLLVALACGALGCSDGAAPGEPIVVSEESLETWVWVEVAGMRCSDGSSSGVFVNFTDRSRDLLLYFQGGGACWSGITCAVQSEELAPLQPDPLAQFMSDGEHAQSGVFDRADPSNPLRDSNFVFVPYCTGDGHLGDEIGDYGSFGTIHHVGYTNVTAMIERLVPTFVDAPRIVIGGFSAGALGATGNYHQIVSAFESAGRAAPIALIADAGPIMRPPYFDADAQAKVREAWGLDRTIEPWCPTCATEGYHEVYRRAAELHPGMRSSILCSYGDSVVQLLYGALGTPIVGDREKEGLLDLAEFRSSTEASVAPSAFREFFYEGTRHGATSQVPLSGTPGLAEFLTAQLEGEEGWTSVRP
jgi:hypothetical protein